MCSARAESRPVPHDGVRRASLAQRAHLPRATERTPFGPPVFFDAFALLRSHRAQHYRALRAYGVRVREIDLALYADTLAAKASTLAAELERARDSVRQAAIEQEARRALDTATIARLERLGALGVADARAQRGEIAELVANLAAVEELQAWVEGRLFAAREEAA